MPQAALSTQSFREASPHVPPFPVTSINVKRKGAHVAFLEYYHGSHPHPWRVVRVSPDQALLDDNSADGRLTNRESLIARWGASFERRLEVQEARHPQGGWFAMTFPGYW